MPIAAASGDGLARRPVMMTAETTYARPITMEEQFFGHLPKSVPAHSEDAVKGAKVHPLVIRLGVMMASGELRGANARTHALMIAFREVIRDYVSPDNADLWKDLPQHLSPNIAYLEGCRPKGIGGGNAIRWLKQEITRFGENEDDDMSEAEVCRVSCKGYGQYSDEQQKEFLMNAITTWITERMTAADDLIAENAKDKIQPGDTVVTFAR
jgi:translation initiation factor eIF-2B subunit delta